MNLLLSNLNLKSYEFQSLVFFCILNAWFCAIAEFWRNIFQKRLKKLLFFIYLEDLHPSLTDDVLCVWHRINSFNKHWALMTVFVKPTYCRLQNKRGVRIWSLSLNLWLQTKCYIAGKKFVVWNVGFVVHIVHEIISSFFKK